MSKISEFISTTTPICVSKTSSHRCEDCPDDTSVEYGEYKHSDQPSSILNSIAIQTIPNAQDYNNGLTEINQEIDRPMYYASKSGRDVIDWCEDFGLMDNAYIFNIFKYLCRAGKKFNNSMLQDALKAQIYLNRFIENLQK